MQPVLFHKRTQVENLCHHRDNEKMILQPGVLNGIILGKFYGVVAND